MGVKSNLVISTAEIEGHLPPQLEAHRLFSQFAHQPVEKLWISISNFPGSFKPNCAYLRTFALFLHLYTQKEVGFQS
jgi:hypothetical protein